MKLTIYSLAIITMMLSCTTAPKKMNTILDHIQIGMSENDFRQQLKDEELISSNGDKVIYRVITKGSYGDFAHKFFYFENGKLIRIDEGERNIDFRMKIE